MGALARKAPLITPHTFTAPVKLKALILKDTKTTHNPTPPTQTHTPFPDVPTMPTLRYDPKKYTYTDGSCISSNGGNLLGAAYYHAPTQLHTHVNPNGALTMPGYKHVGRLSVGTLYKGTHFPATDGGVE
jgi:hypothetical protein